MSKPVDRDLLREFPALAELRDKWGMRTASSEEQGMHWVVRLEGDSFDLIINNDRGDGDFHIRPKGSSQDWRITTVLHEMGLWDNLQVRVDDRKLARALEQNLTAALRYISEQERPRSLDKRSH